jgi:hypothetical protein
MTSFYEKTTNGERGAELFTRTFGRAKRRNIMAMCSMEENSFCEIC